MDKVTMLKRLLRPGLLIVISIILISFDYTLAGIILLIFHCITLGAKILLKRILKSVN